MPQFRKKPDNTVYTVEQYSKANPHPTGVCYKPDCGVELLDHVHTAHEQVVVLAPGDWIMPEPEGRGYYPIKPDIFADRYEYVVPDLPPITEESFVQIGKGAGVFLRKKLETLPTNAKIFIEGDPVKWPLCTVGELSLILGEGE